MRQLSEKGHQLVFFTEERNLSYVRKGPEEKVIFRYSSETVYVVISLVYHNSENVSNDIGLRYNHSKSVYFYNLTANSL